MVLKFGHFGQYIRNIWKVLKYEGAGEGQRCSFGRNVWKNPGGRERSPYFEMKSGCVDHILCRDCLIKHVILGNIGENDEEDVSSCWMSLRKREDTGSWKKKQWITLGGELSFEEAVEMSQDGWINCKLAYKRLVALSSKDLQVLQYSSGLTYRSWCESALRYISVIGF